MTMQLRDTVLYQEKKYGLLSRTGNLFVPYNHGIETEMRHTACIRGFLCTYEIRDDLFLLSSLELRTKNGLYPLINDTAPSFPDGFFDGRPAWARYEEIGLRMPFTGQIRFGQYVDARWRMAFLDPDSRHALFGPEEWMCCQVFEADVVDGQVKSVTDLSEEMAKIREQQPLPKQSERSGDENQR